MRIFKSISNSPVNLIAFIIVVTALVLAITSVWDDSPVVDEIPHIGAGYFYVTQGSYEMNPEHPPLAKDLAGLALLALPLNSSALTMPHPGFWPTDIHGQWYFGRNFIFNSGNDAIKITHYAKMPLLIFFILSALITFLWSKKIYGKGVALTALFLFSFSPTVIAHSRLVTTDMAALFGILVGLYFYIRFIKNQNSFNLVLAGLMFGVSQLTKFSTFLIIPLFILLVFAWGAANKSIKVLIKSFLLTCIIFVIGYVVVVWPVYALHTRNYNPQIQKQDASSILESYGYNANGQPTLQRKVADVVVWASDKPVIRPLAEYALGVLMVVQRNAGGNTTYFFGQINFMGSWVYFPIVYFIKEPLAFWMLALFAIIGFFMWTKGPKFRNTDNWLIDHFAEFSMLLWMAIYWFTSVSAHLNIGVRHLLPTFAFAYILVSGQVFKIFEKIKYKKKLYISFVSVIAVLLGWYLYENIKIYPYYLTYFNQAVGGPSGGYEYVVDSNLDWGQDLKRTSDWVKQNNISKLNLDYFGWADPSYYLKDKYFYTNSKTFEGKSDFLNKNPGGGYLAVSATFYMNARNLEKGYLWLSNIKPTTTIGNSIFVWHITP